MSLDPADAPRLKAKIWVAAALRQAQARGAFGAVVVHGDDDAGNVLVLLRARSGAVTVLDQTRDAAGRPAWIRARRDVTGSDAEAFVARARDRDPDLWVVEFDADDGLPPFEARMID